MPKLSRSPLGALLPFQRLDRVDDHGKYLSDPVTTADHTEYLCAHHLMISPIFDVSPSVMIRCLEDEYDHDSEPT